MLARAEALAKRLANGTNEARVAALYRATLGREPEPEELRFAKRFVAQSGLSIPLIPHAKLWIPSREISRFCSSSSSDICCSTLGLFFSGFIEGIAIFGKAIRPFDFFT